MSKRFDLGGSPEDRATYVAWRLGVIISYCFVAVVVAAVVVATHGQLIAVLLGACAILLSWRRRNSL
jgi:hypothetical protein